MRNQMDDKSLIEFLIQRGTLLFGEFKLKSGRISPYFFNLGLVMTDGKGIQTISKAYTSTIRNEIGIDNITFLLGPAYKGIPLVTQVAATLFEQGKNIRWGYNRKEAKTHGEASLKKIGQKIQIDV